jgi:translocation and assembly module TamA
VPPLFPLPRLSRLLIAALLAGAGTAVSIVARADTPYTTEFTGIEDSDLADLVRSASQLVALKDRVPPSVEALRRRAESDQERLVDVLHSEGYYEPSVDFAIDQQASPAKVTVTIKPGPRSTLAEVRLVDPQGSTPPLADQLAPTPLRPAAFGLTLNDPARSAPIVAAESRIVQAYAERGYPLAKIVGRRTVLDTATNTMSATYTIDPGPPAKFDGYQIEGLQRLERGYVERRIAWQEGTPYDESKLEATRQLLTTSGLFSSVRITHGDTVGADGRIPVTIALTERPERTIGGGLSYDSSLGPAASASWEHRNLFGGAESLSFKGVLGTSQQSLTGQFRRPDLGTVNRDLVVNGSFDNDLVEAFHSLGEKLSVGVEQRFDNNLTAGGAIGFEHARVDEKSDFRTYTLVGLPMFFRKDGSDDLLNPTRGYRIGATSTPYLRALGSNLTFLSSKLTGSTYLQLTQSDRAILALSGAVGSIVGTSLDSIPKDHRLYVGGGGSIRGFPYQKAGTRDQFNDPTGGRSSVEASLELRLKLTETIGIVPFLDAGNVYSSEFPDFSGKLRYGAGIGLRYYTSLGPVRFDIASPINPERRDPPVQVYVSLGQAF